MRCVGRFYAIAKNDIFLVEKSVKQFFIYFSMTGGASSYDKSIQGIDRPFDNLFPNLIKNLSLSFQNKILQDNQKHAEASQHYILWISFCVIISTLFIIASFWTAIKTTRKDKFNH